MSLLIVSNRLPVTAVSSSGKFTLKKSSGGLVTGMNSYLESLDEEKRSGIKWIGWPGRSVSSELQERLRLDCQKMNLHPIFLTQVVMDNFYLGFCNKTIWPLFHYFLVYTEYINEYWETYKFVNEAFCNEILNIYKPGDTIWIHDYHLMLLPGMLRERLPDAKIGFFLHIPFPAYETFRMLPKKWRESILKGILGADLIGFHTYDYQKYFLHSVLRILGYENNVGLINLPERIVKADNFPMGIDYEGFLKAARSNEAIKEKQKIRKHFSDSKIIFSIDRLDYTKGIINRLRGYECFLSENPQWLNKVNLVMIVIPSRIGVDRYELMKNEVDEKVGYINGKFGNIHWTPVIYQYKTVGMNTLAGLYDSADIALITPLRDGMNLISKEYIACNSDMKGVLILSEMAGASKELGEAIIINPNNDKEIADAISDALQMSEGEQLKRNSVMQGRLKRYNVNRWAGYFLDALDKIKHAQSEWEMRLLDDELADEVIDTYKHSQNSIFFLDYDGTLVPFEDSPEKAEPPPELKEVVRKLSLMPNTDVILISGRNRESLGKWFKDINITLSAEHGAWLKHKNTDWKLQNLYKTDWKEAVYPYLENYTDMLPGSFIEEKDFTLVWHFRKCDPEQSSVKARELLDDLVHVTGNLDVQVMQGNKIIEIRNKGISKGNITSALLERKKFSFIFAAGDDWTDEEMFRALPESACTVKIGMSSSYAKYNLESCYELRNLLKQFIDETQI